MLVKLQQDEDGEEVLRVHRTILAMRSKMFRVMFRTKMQESNAKELDMSHLPNRVTRTFFKYLYTGSLDVVDDKHWSFGEAVQLLNLAEMHEFTEVRACRKPVTNLLGTAELQSCRSNGRYMWWQKGLSARTAQDCAESKR